VSHKKALLTVMVALSAIVLVGFVSVSLTVEEPVSYHHQNDRANHHPQHVNG
jgi:hypothetical protein